MLDYFFAIINLIIVSLFISLIFKQHRIQLLFISLYYICINLLFYHYNHINRGAEIYIAEYISVVFVSYFTHKICKKFKESISNTSPFIKIGELFFANDRRILILITLLSAVLALTSTLGILKYHNIEIISPEFYTSWVVDVLFFILVGFSIASIGLRLPHLEDFSTRVGILFSGSNLDSSLKSPALTSLEDDIKQLGLMAKETHRQITITEYNSKYRAFKIQVTTKSTLVSMFGDVKASDNINFAVKPDDFSKQKNIPKIIGQVISLYDEDIGELLSKPVQIFQSGSKNFQKTFTVGSEPKTIIFKYWSWVKPNEPLGFRPTRFCCLHSATIVNRMTNKRAKKILLRIYLDNPKNKIDLAYGERWEVEFKGVVRGELKKICSLVEPKF